MNRINNAGTVVDFTDGYEFADGEVIGFDPSRPGKDECVKIGWAYSEADEQAQTAMLDELGPVLIRRSLQAFGTYSASTGQSDVAEYAAMLRAEIKVVPSTKAGSAS